MVAVFKKAIHKAHVFFARIIFETTCTIVSTRAWIVIAGLIRTPRALVVVTSRFNHHGAIAENAAGRNDGRRTSIDLADVCGRIRGAV